MNNRTTLCAKSTKPQKQYGTMFPAPSAIDGITTSFVNEVVALLIQCNNTSTDSQDDRIRLQRETQTKLIAALTRMNDLVKSITPRQQHENSLKNLMEKIKGNIEQRVGSFSVKQLEEAYRKFKSTHEENAPVPCKIVYK